MVFPKLREELDLLPGPVLADGQPSWTLHDPSRNLFFRIDWPTFEVMQRWDMADCALIAEDIDSNTTLSMDSKEVEEILRFMTTHQLVQPADPHSAAKMSERWQTLNQGWWKWLLHHYLFFRIPLWNPDRWLSSTLHWLEPLDRKSVV